MSKAERRRPDAEVRVCSDAAACLRSPGGRRRTADPGTGDEGRATTANAHNPYPTAHKNASMAKYPEIEKQTGSSADRLLE